MKKDELASMTLDQIKKRLKIAIDCLLVNDNYLFEIGAHERSIAHKLAVYMEQTFGKIYDVDLEYNRNIDKPKEIIRVNAKPEKILPDIIVHKRGTEINLLIIEIERSESSSRDDDRDAEKLRCYTDPTNKLNYTYGAFIKFRAEPNESPKIEYYEKGQKRN